MTAKELSNNYENEKFKIKGGRYIWEKIEHTRNGKILIERDTKEKEFVFEGKNYGLGLGKKRLYINPNTEIEIVF